MQSNLFPLNCVKTNQCAGYLLKIESQSQIVNPLDINQLLLSIFSATIIDCNCH